MELVLCATDRLSKNECTGFGIENESCLSTNATFHISMHRQKRKRLLSRMAFNNVHRIMFLKIQQV